MLGTENLSMICKTFFSLFVSLMSISLISPKHALGLKSEESVSPCPDDDDDDNDKSESDSQDLSDAGEKNFNLFSCIKPRKSEHSYYEKDECTKKGKEIIFPVTSFETSNSSTVKFDLEVKQISFQSDKNISLYIKDCNVKNDRHSDLNINFNCGLKGNIDKQSCEDEENCANSLFFNRVKRKKSSYDVFYSSIHAHHPAEINKVPWRQLNKEWWRLHTFSKYPRNAPHSSIILARQGFVYIGNGDPNDDSILCVFCLSAVKDLDGDSDIEELHHNLNPNCPIIRGVNCGNTLIKEYDSKLIIEILHRLRSLQTKENSSQDSNATQHYEDQAMPIEVDGPDVGPTSGTVLQANISNLSHHQQSTRDSVSHGAHPQVSENDAYTETVTNRAASLSILPSADDIDGGHISTVPQPVVADAASTGETRADNIHPSNVSSSNRNESVCASSNQHISSMSHNNTGSFNELGSQEGHQNVPANSQASNNNPVSSEAQASSDSTRAPRNEDTAPQEGGGTSYDKLGIITARPKRHEYAVEVTRLNSFEGWPSDHHIKPEDLAKAGYFYTGYSDCARCFYCGGGLRNWEIGDDVWVEHARWFPKCAYMRQCVGQSFIDVVQDLNKEQEMIPYDDVVKAMEERGLGHIIPKDIKNKSSELERDAAVKTVVECGFRMEDVIKAAEIVKENGLSLAADILYEELLKSNTPKVSNAVISDDSQSISKKGTEKRNRETIESLKSENGQLRQQSQCKICMDREVAVVFLPCGHLISCNDCSFALKTCPVCRDSIKGVVRAYLA